MKQTEPKFERYFRALSYGVTASGLFALYFSGGVGVVVTCLFGILLVSAWFLEGSKWQLSERLGVILIVLMIPFSLLEWRFQFVGLGFGKSFAVGGLAILILFLCAIKLLQKKSDRDWVFIYVISFFEILLAAGLSISPMFILSLFSFLLFIISAIVAFEIRKTGREFSTKASNITVRTIDEATVPRSLDESGIRLSAVAAVFLFLITVFAVPLFFALPRVGGAGLGSNLAGNGDAITGFSDSVRLGEIGTLKKSNKTVMRVKVERSTNSVLQNFYWRGIALDQFDQNTWSKSKTGTVEQIIRGSNGFFPVNRPNRTEGNIDQTFYVEPIGTSILFALSKPILVRGQFGILRKDRNDSLRGSGLGFERASYSVRSDRSGPPVNILKSDEDAYPLNFQRFLQLPPGFDQRIRRLASGTIERSGATNRYDKAKAIETFFRTEYGYSLDMRASGPDPLSDFLFNVREGHCEYFSTAMAVMLRTQGIATRVVNGFQQGEFNESAGLYIVKQRDAHSWVEVYFPETRRWITFDPTPSEGQFSESTETSFLGSFNNYLEAMEAYWVQYFVSYDSQEQKSLFESARNSFAKYKDVGSNWFQIAQKKIEAWWGQIRGDEGLQASLIAIAMGLGYSVAAGIFVAFLIWLFRRVAKLGIVKTLGGWWKTNSEIKIIEFYERMQKILASQGIKRASYQTPLEFALELNVPEAVKITEKYNGVRFGERSLTGEEANQIETWLKCLEDEGPANVK